MDFINSISNCFLLEKNVLIILDLLKNCGEMIIIILQKEFLISEVKKSQERYLFKRSNI